MSNEELALCIQKGDQDKLGELWAQVEKFVSMRAGKMARHLDGFGGVTEEDLYQAGFLALVEAVETFDPDRGGGFLSWLDYHLKTEFAQAAGYRSVKRDALDFAADLEAQLPDAEGITLADALESLEASRDYEEVERHIWISDLRRTLDLAMKELSPLQRDTLEAHYYQGQPLREIAEKNGVSVERVRQRKQQALRQLHRNRKRNRLADFVEERTPYYLRVGVCRFNTTGTSPVEEIVLIRERLRECTQAD